MTDHDALPPDEAPAITPLTPAPMPALSRRERAAVLARIHALMEYWGITLAELDGTDAPPPALAARAELPIKYRHPVSGETWDGQGPHPEWLRHALLKEGLRVEELKP